MCWLRHTTRAPAQRHSYAVLSLLYSRTHENAVCFCHPVLLAWLSARIVDYFADLPLPSLHTVGVASAPWVTTGASNNNPSGRDYLHRLCLCPLTATRGDAHAVQWCLGE